MATSRTPCRSGGPSSRLEVHGDIGVFTATISYLLAPTDDGTRLTNVVDLESASGALRLLAPLAASRVKTAVAANLDTLKQLLETQVPQLERHLKVGNEPVQPAEKKGQAAQERAGGRSCPAG
jgi:hypothetical protein